MAQRPTPAMPGQTRMATRPAIARGRLVITGDITCLSHAGLFAARGKATPLWLRLPAAVPARLATPPFGLTFQTEDGPWDLPLRLLPVEFLRRPDRRPALDLAAAEGEAALWDVLARHPETLHALLHAFTDAGAPASWRQAALHGADVHSLGPAGRQAWCRFRLAPEQEAAAPGEGLDPSALFAAMAQGAPASWRLMLQIMTEPEAREAPFDAFDATCLWPTARWPWIEVGVVTLEGRLDLAPARMEAAPRLVPGIALAPRAPRRPRALPDAPHPQVAEAFRALAEEERARLADRLAAALRPLPGEARRRLLDLFGQVDGELGAGLTRRLRPRPALMAAE
jgi:catalase